MSGIFAAVFGVVFCMLIGLYAQGYRVYAQALSYMVRFEQQKVIMRSCAVHACGYYRVHRHELQPLTFSDGRWVSKSKEPYRAICRGTTSGDIECIVYEKDVEVYREMRRLNRV